MKILKLSLRIKFYLIVLPPVITLLALLIVIISPARKIHRDIIEVRINSSITVLAEQFIRHISRQMKEASDFAMSGQSEDEAQFEQAGEQARLVLAQLHVQAKAQNSPEQATRDSKLLADVEDSYDAAMRQSQKIFDLARQGKQAQAQGLVSAELDSYFEGHLISVIDKFRADHESKIDTNLARLSARLDQFGIFTPGSLQSKIMGVRNNLVATSQLDRFAHSLINEIKEYAESVLKPAPEQAERLSQASLNTQAALLEWQEAEESLGQHGHRLWLEEVREQLKAFDSIGQKAIALARNGDSGGAIATLEQGHDRLLDQTFYPSLSQKVIDRERELEQDLDFIGRSISRLSLFTSAFSIFVALAALSWPWLLSRRIIVPILKLQNFAREVGTGEMEGRVEIKSNDELGSLAASFNQMVERLRASRGHLFHSQQLLQQANSDLEGQVLSRTTELSQANKQLQAELLK